LPRATTPSWLNAGRAGRLGEIGKQQQLSDIELELARAKRELDQRRDRARYHKKIRGVIRRCKYGVPISIVCHSNVQCGKNYLFMPEKHN